MSSSALCSAAAAQSDHGAALGVLRGNVAAVSAPQPIWDHLKFMVTDPRRRKGVMDEEDNKFPRGIPFRTIALFTALKTALLTVIWAVTVFAGIAASNSRCSSRRLSLSGCGSSPGCSRRRPWRPSKISKPCRRSPPAPGRPGTCSSGYSSSPPAASNLI